MAMNTTAGPAFTTVAVQDTEEDDTALQKYHRESAARCPMNDTSNCCTCRCCAFCIAICWVIFGAIGAYSASAETGKLELIDTCPTDSLYEGEQCCEYDAGAVSLYYEADMCDKLKTAWILSMVDNIIACLAGVAGVVGLVQFISWLLLVPVGYAAVAVVLSIVATVLIAGGQVIFYAVPIISIIIAIALAILFWTNYKLIKDILGK